MQSNPTTFASLLTYIVGFIVGLNLLWAIHATIREVRAIWRGPES